ERIHINKTANLTPYMGKIHNLTVLHIRRILKGLTMVEPVMFFLRNIIDNPLNLVKHDRHSGHLLSCKICITGTTRMAYSRVPASSWYWDQVPSCPTPSGQYPGHSPIVCTTGWSHHCSWKEAQMCRHPQRLYPPPTAYGSCDPRHNHLHT